MDDIQISALQQRAKAPGLTKKPHLPAPVAPGHAEVVQNTLAVYPSGADVPSPAAPCHAHFVMSTLALYPSGAAHPACQSSAAPNPAIGGAPCIPPTLLAFAASLRQFEPQVVALEAQHSAEDSHTNSAWRSTVTCHIAPSYPRQQAAMSPALSPHMQQEDSPNLQQDGVVLINPRRKLEMGSKPDLLDASGLDPEPSSPQTLAVAIANEAAPNELFSRAASNARSSQSITTRAPNPNIPDSRAEATCMVPLEAAQQASMLAPVASHSAAVALSACSQSCPTSRSTCHSFVSPNLAIGATLPACFGGCPTAALYLQHSILPGKRSAPNFFLCWAPQTFIPSLPFILMSGIPDLPSNIHISIQYPSFNFNCAGSPTTYPFSFYSRPHVPSCNLAVKPICATIGNPHNHSLLQVLACKASFSVRIKPPLSLTLYPAPAFVPFDPGGFIFVIQPFLQILSQEMMHFLCVAATTLLLYNQLHS